MTNHRPHPLTEIADSPWLGRTARDLEGIWGTVRRVYATPSGDVAVLIPGHAWAPRLELVELLRERGRPAVNTQFMAWHRGFIRLLKHQIRGTITERGRKRFTELDRLMRPLTDTRALAWYALLAAVTRGDRVHTKDAGPAATVTGLGDLLPVPFDEADPEAPRVQVPLTLRLRFDGTQEETERSSLMFMPTLGLTSPQEGPVAGH